MSAYRIHESQIRLQDAILEALVDRICQYRRLSEADARKLVNDQVKICSKPESLKGWQGDKRTQKAHIIVPQALVNSHLGGRDSNDLGFIQKNGKFQAIISDYDRSRWWNHAAPRFWQAAQTFEAMKAARLQGYQVKKEEKGGVITLTCLSRR